MSLPTTDRVGRAFTHWRVANPGPRSRAEAFRAGWKARKHAQYQIAYTPPSSRITAINDRIAEAKRTAGIVDEADASSLDFGKLNALMPGTDDVRVPKWDQLFSRVSVFRDRKTFYESTPDRKVKDEMTRFAEAYFAPDKINHVQAASPIMLASKELVRSVLEHPFHRKDWTIQGLGMLRTYLDPERRFRLNIWNASLAKITGVSSIHDHPWDFTSYVIAGEFCNTRFEEIPLRNLYVGQSVNYHYQTIKCGGSVDDFGPVKSTHLRAWVPEQYMAGDSYRQEANEIHSSSYLDGTCTINDRLVRGDGCTARVFWPIGEERIDAAPRKATDEEVWNITHAALRTWFGFMG